MRSKDTKQYKDLFTFSQHAQLWDEIYTKPKEVYQHNMIRRRDCALAYALTHCQPGARILDLGCGAGVFMEKLLENGFDLTGTDVSGDMLTLTQKRLEKFPPDRYRVLRADCITLPFSDNQFDFVICLGVFGYIEDVDRALCEIRRILRPGGIFFMSIRNSYNSILSDPYRLIVWAARRTARLLGITKLKRMIGASNTDGHDANNDHRFHIAILDSPPRVIRGISRQGYTLESFDGFGFGPISLVRRSVFPLSMSIKISDFLSDFFLKTRLNFLTRWIADVSIYIFRKI